MNSYSTTLTEKISQEVQETPDEYLSALLELVHLFRESVTLKPAEASFQQGWREAINGETLPIEQLWDGVDAQG